MHYAIIAAGQGSRLLHEGISIPKPLVCLGGRPMIDRLIAIFLRNDAESISVIVNDAMVDVQQHLQTLNRPEVRQQFGMALDFPFLVIVKTTPSSMHSFEQLTTVVPAGRLCLTTVDTIFDECEFSAFIRAYSSLPESQADGMFAVTSFVDDENPLWVGVDAEHHITGFYDDRCGCRYVSGGIYAFPTNVAFPILHRCIASGLSRLRNFQRALIGQGCRLVAYPFSQIIDVDHSADLVQAEAFIAQSREQS